ncbi:alpha/beta fold hydrolase [Orrella sp. 11846]|uniref:alpha/beta hydrolase n=1 Tax=Orrella sp. 11846 TaxID=3409913 RepID=UPI003B5BF3E3
MKQSNPDALQTSKTYVLLHGAWHGGWCWREVAAALRQAGHQVYTPTQTGLGERSHLLSKDITLDVFIDDLKNVLTWEDLNDVVLVGHSFGGIVISAVADQMPERIRHLVYLDSLILQNGQSAFSVISADVADERRALSQASSGGVSIPIPTPEAMGVSEPSQAAWLMSKCTPHPIATYESVLTLNNPVGNGLPATYVAVVPEYGPTTSSRTFAKTQKDWRYLEMDAGHDAMLTSPDAVIRLLLSI